MLPPMKASPDTTLGRQQDLDSPPGISPAGRVMEDPEIDLSLLEDSLARTPWERMLANDDALRFGDALRDAMEKRRAEPQ
jgi:hypothetical protein